jgi:hypothetical protein
MDAATTAALSESLRRALQTEKVDAALAEFGWREAYAEEGLPVAAVLFTEQGTACATSGALDDVLCAALGLGDGSDVAVILPVTGHTTMPGSTVDGSVVVRGLATARLRDVAQVVVVADDRAFVTPAASLRAAPIGGIDPAIGLSAVEGVLTADAATGAAVDWSHAVTVGQLALSFELVGVSRAMLALAREHALVRMQFDRPIAGFQAVRHRLAESLVAIESAQAIADAAVESAAAGPLTPLLASIAKAVAGRGARTVARHCQQVLAGIGFTDESPYHRYLRRALVLDGLLGGAKTLTAQLGSELLRSRALPPAPPL